MKLRTLEPRFLRQITEVTLRFVGFETLSSLLPVAVVIFLAGVVDQSLLIHFISPIRLLWWLVVQSFLVGRFTLAAMDGQFNADIFEPFPYGKLPKYMLRYLTISLVWALPLGGLIYINLPVQEMRLSGLLEWLISQVYLSGSKPFQPDFGFWLVIIAIAVGSALPLYTAVLAAMARSPIHVMFPSLWKHPFKAGTPPLLLFIAFLGSMAAAFFIYLPLLGSAAVVAFHLSPTLGKLLASLSIAMPVMSWPIIAGRLAGTWVHFHPLTAEADISPIVTDEVVMPPVFGRATAGYTALPATGAVPVVTSPEPEQITLPLVEEDLAHETLVEIEAKIVTDGMGAAKQLIALKKNYPNDARILGLEVRILIQLGHKSKALSLAIPAVQALALTPHSQAIVPVFVALGKDRHTLPWESTILDLLVKVFVDAKEFKEAGWCAHTCELQIGNVVNAGKRLVQVADTASEVRDFESAVALYKYYQKHHPDGPFAEYAKKAIDFNQKQLAP